MKAVLVVDRGLARMDEHGLGTRLGCHGKMGVLYVE
jgi:hypothetical protein